MTVLVTDAGFAAVPATDFVTLDQIAAHKGAVDLAHTDDPEALAPYLSALSLIRVAFPAFSDGRAFTIARRLRALGYTGTLRANPLWKTPNLFQGRRGMRLQVKYTF